MDGTAACIFVFIAVPCDRVLCFVFRTLPCADSTFEEPVIILCRERGTCVCVMHELFPSHFRVISVFFLCDVRVIVVCMAHEPCPTACLVVVVAARAV